MRDLVLRAMKLLKLELPIDRLDDSILITDNSGIGNLPVSYRVTDNSILIKYAKLPYQKKITLNEFKKIIIRRAEMTGENRDIDDLFNIMKSFILQWGCGAIPIEGDTNKRTIWDVIVSYDNRTNQSKSISKVSNKLKKQVEEMSIDKVTKESDNKG